MGTGRWESSSYKNRVETKRSMGYSTPMSHTEDVAAGRVERKVHEALDPKKPNTDGKIIRESRDNDEHPESLAIAVIFDETGSMKEVPLMLQKKLPELYGLLLRKGYVEHPQVLFGAIGDATGWGTTTAAGYGKEVAPLQVGQFESDNRADEALENILLEGMGGGGNHESYQLAAYFMARHTELDCLDKRGKKGYLFFIGDERTYAQIDPMQIKELIGDDLPERLSTADVFEELKEKFNVFFLFAKQGSYLEGDTLDPNHPEKRGVNDSSMPSNMWGELVGQNALVLEDAGGVCETIALTIGMMEGAVTYEDGMADLEEVSTDLTAIKAAGAATKELAAVGAGSSAVAETTGEDLPAGDEGESGTERV